MLSLAVPVVLAEIGWMGMGVVDTVMVGRVGPEAIGAVGIGRALFMGATVFGIGLLLGLDTLVSTAHGAGDRVGCARSLQHGVLLAVAVAVPTTALLLAVVDPLGAWGLDPRVLAATRPYLRAVSWSALPVLLYTAFRRYLQGVNRVRPVMLALVSANVVNVAANWVLIFGHLGAPPLGAAGAGWATCIAMSYMAVFLLVASRLHLREEPTGPVRWRFEPARLRRLLALGLPAALHVLLEVAAFALGTALAGRLDPASVAAHQIVLTLASLTFMVPLGLSSAAAVRVGQAIGRGDPQGAGRQGWLAVRLGSAFMLAAGLAIVAAPVPLLRVFTDDREVIATGVALLAVAALFQFVDGLQVVTTGALRGLGDTRSPMVWNLIGHWALGLPLGYWVCFERGWGAVGLWSGWLVGLATVGAVLTAIWSGAVRRAVVLRAAGTPPPGAAAI